MVTGAVVTALPDFLVLCAISAQERSLLSAVNYPKGVAPMPVLLRRLVLPLDVLAWLTMGGVSLRAVMWNCALRCSGCLATCGSTTGVPASRCVGSTGSGCAGAGW